MGFCFYCSIINCRGVGADAVGAPGPDAGSFYRGAAHFTEARFTAVTGHWQGPGRAALAPAQREGDGGVSARMNEGRTGPTLQPAPLDAAAAAARRARAASY